MTYQASKLCKHGPDYPSGPHYVVEPGVMFPATVKRILEVLTGEMPAELAPEGKNLLLEPGLKEFLEQAQAFDPKGYEFALKSKDETPKELLGARSAALAYAESYFHRALTTEVGGKILIHITKDETYRR